MSAYGDRRSCCTAAIQSQPAFQLAASRSLISRGSRASLAAIACVRPIHFDARADETLAGAGVVGSVDPLRGRSSGHGWYLLDALAASVR